MVWLVIEPDHPAFPGHFPGQPLIPGVVLLERVLELAREALDPAAVLAGVPVAKFLMPLRPGGILMIGLEPVSVEQLRFVCRSDAGLAAHGTFRLARPVSE